jgi:dinuclear metal center YbgI/SA1388 family protein
MKIIQIIQILEKVASTVYQENYDNCGLITGNKEDECTGILCTLDATNEVLEEAKAKGCNLVVTHHPIIFSGLKKINDDNYVGKAVITSIKNDIAIYAIHTNLDNVLPGVNDKIASQIGLINRRILLPKPGQLMKLFTFVPVDYAEKLKVALFDAGGGHIGNYSETSFSSEGTGTYKAGGGAHPFLGELGIRHQEKEIKIEVLFPAYLQQDLVKAMISVHPYEEVAYDLVPLANSFKQVGTGLIGELPEPVAEGIFLSQLKKAFRLKVIRHTPLFGRKESTIAVCGGSGSFLTGNAIAARADFYITADVKYHEFFDANGKIVIADIGHWESEQFTPELLVGILQANFPTFAVLKSEVITNPVKYFI